jgi:hypothetical protein
MKTIAIIILGITGIILPVSAQQLVKIEVKYKNIDSKWLAEIGIEGDANSAIKVPSCTSREGQAATIQLIREYRSSTAHEHSPVVECGFTIDLTPRIHKEGILLTGKNVLRRPISVKAKGISTHFEASETIIDVTLKNGEPESVPLQGGGSMIVTATLIDATGSPVKE